MLKSTSVDEMRQKCSEVTLQSESQGHFGNFVRMIYDHNPDCLRMFSKLETDEERVMYCTMLHRMDHMIVKPVFKTKNAELAKTKRAEGNEAFQKKRYKQAMMLYTMSVMKSPHNGSKPDESLSYAVANRSACFYYLGDMESCLKDIDYAISSGYPDQLKYKLHERKAKCYILLEKYDSAKTALNVAKKSFENNKAKLEEKKREQTIKSFKEIQDAISNKKPLAGEHIILDDNPVAVIPKLTSGTNKKMRHLSNLVKVQYKEGVGRHVVAGKPIKAGDTVAVEHPFAAVLYPDKVGTNCDNCFTKLRSAVPCPTCAGVAYCSVTCREQASWHRYECQYGDLILGLGSSALVRLAYRIVASQSMKFFNNIKHHLNVDEKKLEIDNLALNYNIPGVDKDTYLSYLNLFNLVGLDSDRWVEDKFNRAMMAVCLLKILKASNYFPNKSDADTFTSDELFIGSLMMRHMNILQFNAHEVYELLRGDRSRMKPNKNCLIGVGVYPQASYFNHSCHPGTSRYNVGKTMVLRSLVPVSPGQEVSENYGPVFYFKSKADRQKELSSRYWFNCDCKACQEDYPLLKEATKVKWKADKNESALDDLRTVYECGADFLEHAQCDDAMDSLTEYINEVYTLVDPPLETVIRAEDKLRTCFNNSGTVLFQDTQLKTNPSENRK